LLTIAGQWDPSNDTIIDSTDKMDFNKRISLVTNNDRKYSLFLEKMPSLSFEENPKPQSYESFSPEFPDAKGNLDDSSPPIMVPSQSNKQTFT
jgi:hypothetical protein